MNLPETGQDVTERQYQCNSIAIFSTLCCMQDYCGTSFSQNIILFQAKRAFLICGCARYEATSDPELSKSIVAALKKLSAHEQHEAEKCVTQNIMKANELYDDFILSWAIFLNLKIHFFPSAILFPFLPSFSEKRLRLHNYPWTPKKWPAGDRFYVKVNTSGG